MEKYKPKKLLASVADRLLRMLLACAAGIAWFVYLWGVNIPALTAGIALGGLLWLCVRQFSKQTTQKREKQMRQMIGGELALDRLVLSSPKQAGFQATLWIAPRYPLIMQTAVDWGVLGLWNQSCTLVRLIAQHESLPVNAQQLVEVAREVRRYQAERCIVCLTAPLAREAASFAAESDPPMQIVRREELMELAGFHSPATDEELRQLGRKKRKRRTRKEWLEVILSPNRARRYLWYGMGLGTLALLTGQMFYPLPAAACLLLFALCKWHAARIRKPLL